MKLTLIWLIVIEWWLFDWIWFNVNFFSSYLSIEQFELLFCVQDEKDAAIICVKNLIQKYPQIDARLFIGGLKVGVNPKINNMQPAYLSSKYELILVSDAGIRSKLIIYYFCH